MKERPIIFSTDMVKATQELKKTMTRRVIKPQPISYDILADIKALSWKNKNLGSLSRDYRGSIAENYFARLCPYGQVGDQLWVRESWGYHGDTYYMNKNTIHIRYLADGEKRDIKGDIYCPSCGLKTGSLQTPKQNLKYPSNFYDLDEYEQLSIKDVLLHKWWKSIKTIPSIHMPRWASRITLEITEVRVERLQEISEADAQAEGICVVDNTTSHMYSSPNYPDIHRDIFIGLWDSLNAKRGYSWESNPWVWVISFKVVE